MSRDNFLSMNFMRCLAIISVLAVGELAAQVTVLPKMEGEAALAAPANGIDFNNDGGEAVQEEEDPDAKWLSDAKSMADPEDSEDFLNVNRILVNTELYIWNRFADIFDMLRCGIGGGVGLGLEVAVTNYAQLGAYYVALEQGVDFPHFLPPFWLVNFYDKTPIFNVHDTTPAYGTAAFGPWRAETIEADRKQHYIFPRDKWDVRLQANVLLLSAFVDIRTLEISDFLAGFIGLDPSDDDDVADKNITRLPADQFGRGVCNILFGALEIPFNILRVSTQEGDLPGLSKGTFLGVWRCLCREVTGVVELVTFPFGWKPIIEPEYVFQRKRGPIWRTSRPAFYKKYNRR